MVSTTSRDGLLEMLPKKNKLHPRLVLSFRRLCPSFSQVGGLCRLERSWQKLAGTRIHLTPLDSSHPAAGKCPYNASTQHPALLDHTGYAGTNIPPCCAVSRPELRGLSALQHFSTSRHLNYCLPLHPRLDLLCSVLAFRPFPVF